MEEIIAKVRESWSQRAQEEEATTASPEGAEEEKEEKKVPPVPLPPTASRRCDEPAYEAEQQNPGQMASEMYDVQEGESPMPLPPSDPKEDLKVLHLLLDTLRRAGNPNPEATLEQIQKTYPHLGWLKKLGDLEVVIEAMLMPVDPLRALEQASALWHLSRTIEFKRRKAIDHVQYGIEMGQQFHYLHLRHPQTFAQIYQGIETFSLEDFVRSMHWYLSVQWKKLQEVVTSEEIRASNRSLPKGAKAADHPLDEIPTMLLNIIHVPDIRGFWARKKGLVEEDLLRHAEGTLEYLDRVGGALVEWLRRGKQLEEITPDMLPEEVSQESQREQFQSEVHDYLSHRPQLVENPLASKEHARRQRALQKQKNHGRR